jgi:uncharacterized membrane protein
VKQRAGDKQGLPTASQSISEVWVGPLPSPESLKKFGELVPNGAERVLRMVEAEQAHRFEVDRAANETHRRTIDENVADAIREQSLIRLGVWLGWTVSIGCVLAALLSVHLGAHWSVSVAFVGLPIMGVVRTFILRK